MSLETLLSQGNCGRTGARIERCRERLSCYDYDVEYIKGADNEIASPPSRSAIPSNHEETPLADEFVINEIADRLDGNSFDYKEELKDLPRIISEEDWTKSHKREYGEYFGKRLELVVQDWNFLSRNEVHTGKVYDTEYSARSPQFAYRN